MNTKKMKNNLSIFRSQENDGREATPDASPMKKESSYYMDNYEATVTVHKSPPQQRKQYFEFLEIDDETKEEPERTYPSYRLSKRKNLRVTFSDHIEVDVIEDFDDLDNFSDDDEHTGVFEEILYEIPSDKTKGLQQISSSAEFKCVSEDIGTPRGSKSSLNNSGSGSNVRIKSNLISSPSSSKTVSPVLPASNRGTPSPTVSQPLLQKRKTSQQRVSLADLEKKTREYVAKLEDKNKKAETNARVAKALFPDITKKIHAQSNYKKFIANAKRAVEITRRYERPWLLGGTGGGASNQPPKYHVVKKRSDAVHRTTSLPSNFRFSDELPRPRSESTLVYSDNRQRIRNT
ncbi:hypothetical protein ACF0H5_007028 [Mactra antiquata]